MTNSATVAPRGRPAAPDDVQGIQEPRLAWIPPHASTAIDDVLEVADLAGLVLDPWEELVLRGALGERADRRWSAYEVGLCVPRQNGKGTILEARELAGLFAFDERVLIHSAHEQATSSEHFRRLLQLIEGVPEFDRRVLKAPQGKGAESIELRGGQRIFFKTRTGGGGRGWTADFTAFDEAMILPEAFTAALVPTQAARSIHGNPQLWYTGSPVDQQIHEHGVVFARVRERGLAKASRVAWFEWSAEGDDPDQVPEGVRSDPEMWAQANPGLGIRISAEHIQNECEGALGARSFAVERLGIGDWPAASDGGVISVADWLDLIDAQSKALAPVCFAFDVSPNRASASIAVAGRRDDGLAHVEVINQAPGTGWLLDRVAELIETHSPSLVVCDPAGPAGSLMQEINQRYIGVHEVTAREHAQACGLFYDAVDAKTVRHRGQEELTTALRGAVKRSLGDAWAWSRKSSAVDISPLVACTLALWALEGNGPVEGGFEW